MIQRITGRALTTQDVIQTLMDDPGAVHQWGSALDGSAILSAQCGGTQKPAVLITAGVHAHEVGGVHAALQLLGSLKTQQEVHILSLRDPFGFSGVNHCLSFASGQETNLEDHAGILAYLSSHGRLIWQQDRLHCFQLGDMGFIWQPQPAGLEGFNQVNARLSAALVEHPEVFSCLFGKRVLLVNPAPFTEHDGLMKRCWHARINQQGKWLNLNRGFGEFDQPGEVAALQRTLETIQPGLVIDLQEDDTPGFWFTAPLSQANDSTTVRIFHIVHQAVQGKQIPVYRAVEMKADSHRDLEIEGFLQPDEMHPEVFWLNQNRLGQGENLLSYAGRHAVVIGVEAPLQRSLGRRVAETVFIVSTIVQNWMIDPEV